MKTVFPLSWWAALVFALALMLQSPAIHAGAIAETRSEDGVQIILFNEPCKLDAVANLKQRATWTEKGKTHEGCWGGQHGIVAFYFADKTVVLVPSSVFQRVHSS